MKITHTSWAAQLSLLVKFLMPRQRLGWMYAGVTETTVSSCVHILWCSSQSQRQCLIKKILFQHLERNLINVSWGFFHLCKQQQQLQNHLGLICNIVVCTSSWHWEMGIWGDRDPIPHLLSAYRDGARLVPPITVKSIIVFRKTRAMIIPTWGRRGRGAGRE